MNPRIEANVERGSVNRKSWGQAFKFAVEGLRHAARTQRTFRALLLITVAIGVLLVWLRLPLIETAVVILAMAIVLAAELFNTGAEAIADLLVERNEHRLAKLAKDVAAGAVLVAVAAASLVGVLLLGPPLAVVVGIDKATAERFAQLAAVLAAIVGSIVLFRLRRRQTAEQRPPAIDRRPEVQGPPSDDRPFDSAQGRRPTTDDRWL